MLDLNRTSNWIGAGGFLGYLAVTIAVGLGGSNLAGIAGVIGIPFGMLAGLIGARLWKRSHPSKTRLPTIGLFHPA
jgi:hypothetical protein